MNLSHPLVSVVMTTYNHEKYIGEAIESVLDQTLQNFELIIVNDGSTDETDEIIKTFSDSRIHYIYQENQGPSVATNNAILVSKGKYIALMTGDDVCYPHRLEKQYNYLLKKPKRVIFSWVDFIDENSQIFSGKPYLKEDWFNRANKTKTEILKHFFERGNYVNGPTAFLEREALIKSSLYHLTSIQSQDFYMWIKLLGRGYELFILPEKLLKFRVTGKNLSLSENNKGREKFEYRQLIKDFFKHIPANLFKEAFANNIIRHDFNGEIEYELEKAFLYLNYNSILFRNIGAEKLFELLQNEKVLTVSVEKYNFNLPALYKLIANIDNPVNIKSQPLVSVIIPCYNHAIFLPEAVESVIDQTYKNWECIIVNDGSPDYTSEVAKSIINLHKDKKISLVEKSNSGLADARNAGIKQSIGEYILCLDADDKIGANFLEDSVLILQTKPEVGFVYTDVQYFGAKNEKISYGDFNPNLFLRNNQATATSMFRRKVFDCVGGYKTVMDTGLEDWEFWISAYENGWQGYRLAKACFYYRQHATGSMLQNLVGHKSKLQTLFAKIISLHSQLYTKQEVLWSKQILDKNNNANSIVTSSSEIFESPNGLFHRYLEFILLRQSFFQEIGEADNYHQDLRKSLDYIHTFIFSNLDSSSWHKVVNNFIQNANFIPIYFNKSNLKDVYVKRAEIIELFLRNNGCEVDYEFPVRPVNRKKNRLGVLAAHFTPGSETFAYLPVYEYLSRDFEVILYSLKQTGHPLEEYCRSCANSFKLLPYNLSEQVNTIRADNLDLLFIATNVTAVTNQICLLGTHRLARVQVTSGGSVVTTGMRHMDYYISGTLTDPSPTAQEQYREKLVKLEGTAHCFSYGCESDKATAEVDRESLGISEEAVIFISGANFFKIVPELIHTWAKIIAEVPNSILVLLPFGPNWSNAYPKQAFEKHLQNIFSQYGIPADILLVLDPQPVPNREDVKEYFKIADLYLDSYPFSGTTSLIEPLQVNLPVISRQGHTFRSAMGAAMVRSLDIPDLVADSEKSYIQLAVELGTNPELRKRKSDRIKQKMQQNLSFLDSRAYSAQMGALFQQLFQQYQAKDLVDRLGLRDINLVMFPDWHQSEESLYEDFANVLKTMSGNPDRSRMTLLIDTDGIDGEDANLLFSGVAMNLLMEEAVEIADDLEVSLLDELTENEWKLLLSLLQGKISLDNENQNALAKAKAESLKVYG